MPTNPAAVDIAVIACDSSGRWSTLKVFRGPSDMALSTARAYGRLAQRVKAITHFRTHQLPYRAASATEI